MKRALLLLLFWATFAAGQEVALSPVPTDALGDWAQAMVPLRLRATPTQEVKFEGPTLLLAQWGELGLGTARYALLLGVTGDGEAHLWIDADRDRRIVPAERLTSSRGAGYLEWQTTLRTGAGGDYPLGVVWPEGRGYVYLLGGAPRWGELSVEGKRVPFILVDGDLDGTYGSKGDFYAADVDGDGIIHGDPDGHERFSLAEPFTVGERSFRVSGVDPAGAAVKLAPTGYVPPKPPLIPGSPAPDLQFATFPDGRSVSLADLRGKVVLLDFWATWCGPCMEELPKLLELYAAHRDQGFEIVGVSLDTSERDLRAVITDRRIQWPVAFTGKTWDNPLAQVYRVYQIPTTYLLDRNGIIRYRDLRGAELAERVAELLRVPSAPSAKAPEPISLPAGPPRPILELAVPPEVGLPPGGKGTVPVRLVNTSPYEAEEVRVALTGLPAGAKTSGVELPTLPPFGERELEILVELPPTATGIQRARVALVYHYCIGDSCFQIQDEAPLALALGEGKPAAGIPTWWILVALGAGLVVVALLRGRALLGMAVLLLALAGGALAVGLLRGQGVQAWRIASSLCTSCVGIEEVRAEAPTFTPAQRAALQALPGPVHLVVFTTSWCKSCPYAKALVAEAARLSPTITYEVVDAESDRARAEGAGVVRSGKVVVPALLVVPTGRVLFGTTDLAARLLAALGEGR
ncbi:MAG: redoxin domain-containing protein [Candidatus Bipolaricaulota bacterium]|nr:redoxin domain-containing protein [Candidatus Bipolaricaulota bacterium]